MSKMSFAIIGTMSVTREREARCNYRDNDGNKGGVGDPFNYRDNVGNK